MATNETVRQSTWAVPWLEPIEAYRRLHAHQPLLLDGMGRHPESRYAYIALTPHLEARASDDLRIRTDDGDERVMAGDPVTALRDLLEAHRYAEPPGTGFRGGFVGYFAYEFAARIEPTLPRRTTGPDYVLRLCRDALVFDRKQRTVRLITNDLPGEDAAQGRAAMIRQALEEPPEPSAPIRVGAWTPSMDQAAFEEAVGRVQDHIRHGDLFQANIATRFEAPLQGEPAAIFAAMQGHNPSPFMALMDFGDHAVISNSPEQLFATDEGRIRARPIAGTRRRGADVEEDARLEQELLYDAKEQAEHTMLVDLVRNDIAKVAVPGTVHVPERMSVERYRRVMHLVSRVEGEIRPGVDFVDRLAALFPGGTITGAPKHRACLRIHEAEPVPRGPYTGSAGFLSWDQTRDHWNIMIRTLVLQDGVASVHAGSGIVMDSVPAREWDEAGHKAQALLEATGGLTDVPPDDIGTVTRHGAWAPQLPDARIEARVLIVDNYDSFVWNLADYCAAWGATVRVVRNDGDWRVVADAMDPTHVILSPGPGWPSEAGQCQGILEALGDRPTLGVCLGHQIMAEATGGRVEVHHEAIHGMVAPIHHEEQGVLAGMPAPFDATRYHSLIVPEAPPGWRRTAWLADGALMAMEHQERPWVGLQFHPESLCTDGGLEIVRRFLERR